MTETPMPQKDPCQSLAVLNEHIAYCVWKAMQPNTSEDDLTWWLERANVWAEYRVGVALKEKANARPEVGTEEGVRRTA
jgi:hypothetical protein